MLGRSVLLSLVLLLGAALPASSAWGSSDAASTHAYIVANYAFLRAAHANEHAANADVAALNRRFGEQCPDVGAGSPQNEDAQQMSYEVAGALWATLYDTNAAPVHRFVRTVRKLRWSNPQITRIARTYTKSLRELDELTVPDLCGDARAWSASGFKTIPSSTIRYDRHLEEIEGKSIPPRLLVPYEKPSERGIAARAARLETLLENNETRIGQDDWNTLLETLGLNQ